MKKIILLLCFSISSLLSSAQNSIFDFISNSEDHDSLEQFIIEAGLADTLSGTAPFTLFAPTDYAFEQLSLSSEFEDTSSVLLYHLVSGIYSSSVFTNGIELPTLQGQMIYCGSSPLGLVVSGANTSLITDADILTTNGLIHVIDDVVFPVFLPPNTIMDLISNSENHNTLESLLIQTGLDQLLSSQGPFTIFAPDDNAFLGLSIQIGQDSLNSLLSNTELLTQILLYHIIENSYPITIEPGSILFGNQSVVQGLLVQTLQGLNVQMTFNESQSVFYINNSELAYFNQTLINQQPLSNGQVHTISSVLQIGQLTNTIETHSKQFKFQNPVTNNIIIPMNRNSNVQILSTSGQIVYSQNFGGTIDIDTTQLSNGIYLLKVESDNVNQVVKFVK